MFVTVDLFLLHITIEGIVVLIKIKKMFCLDFDYKYFMLVFIFSEVIDITRQLQYFPSPISSTAFPLGEKPRLANLCDPHMCASVSVSVCCTFAARHSFPI